MPTGPAQQSPRSPRRRMRAAPLPWRPWRAHWPGCASGSTRTRSAAPRSAEARWPPRRPRPYSPVRAGSPTSPGRAGQQPTVKPDSTASSNAARRGSLVRRPGACMFRAPANAATSPSPAAAGPIPRRCRSSRAGARPRAAAGYSSLRPAPTARRAWPRRTQRWALTRPSWCGCSPTPRTGRRLHLELWNCRGGGRGAGLRNLLGDPGPRCHRGDPKVRGVHGTGIRRHPHRHRMSRQAHVLRHGDRPPPHRIPGHRGARTAGTVHRLHQSGRGRIRLRQARRSPLTPTSVRPPHDLTR